MIVVVGQAARDLVLRVERVPESGASAPVAERLEQLGGKGANLAVGLRQLQPATEVALVAVLGTDASGDRAFAEAADSGLTTDHIVRRGSTALLLDIVDAGGDRRLFEDVPHEAELTSADVHAAEAAFARADTVVLQLQQPAEALVAAARLATAADALVVLDGAIEGEAREELLGSAQVVRSDAHEAELLTGVAIGGLDDAVRAAQTLLGTGAPLERRPRVVAFAVPGEGNLVAWVGGHRFFPFDEPETVDPTGAGDAFVAGLVTGLRRGDDPASAGRLAADAASSTVQRLGGRPDLVGVRTAGTEPDATRQEGPTR